MDGTKVFVEVGDIANAMIRFIASEDYHRVFNSTYGTTKEDGFKAGLMNAPMIILANCEKYVSRKEG